MKQVSVIGHFGFQSDQLSGQIVKTKNVTDALENRFGTDSIRRVDTKGGLKTLLRAIEIVHRAFSESKNIVIMPAQHALLVFSPLVAIAKRKKTEVKVFYVVIGGWLPQFLQKRSGLVKWLKRFDGIFVETRTMKKALEEQGFQNVYVMPNFKSLHVLEESELIFNTEEPLRLCTFSRVMREKGIEDAVNAVQEVNERYGRTVYSLDIYGQIDDTQTEWFKSLKASFPGYVRYLGEVAFDRSVETLKSYYALLFPTHFYTEGIPGTIIDAYSSGVPVISAEWESYQDVVEAWKCGLSYGFGDFVGLIDSLIWAAEHIEEWNKMKFSCIEKAKEYRPERAIEVLTSRLA